VTKRSTLTKQFLQTKYVNSVSIQTKQSRAHVSDVTPASEARSLYKHDHSITDQSLQAADGLERGGRVR